MKKELLQALAIELAGILQREKKELTRDQLFMRCRDGVSLDDVIDTMTELCRLGAVRAHGGAYKFERMPDFQNKPESEKSKPEAELLSPANEPVTETKAHNVLDTVDGREIKAPEWMRPVHHDSVDHETIELSREQKAFKQIAEGAQKMHDAFFGKRTQATSDDLDMVNHPSHYNAGQIEVIDAIEDWQLGFSLGNAIKYIARHQRKGTPLQDLEKAAWYLQREINRIAYLEKNKQK